ncbi:hypothetical protein [Metabacillus malikii]|uniref:Uncharacterized protein n=1 Tax=Metabacillus malikii TaxID=1504265 RepID=A0ABT9Z9V1_9BACI|nr:hypothetical protein [Metabacillus malikii]MDQ0229022.1 hypothetical protein [Metabacillus malikii]
MLTTQTYIQDVKQNLQKASEKLIQQIRHSVNFQYDERVKVLDYTAFTQVNELSIMMYSMDRSANEVFYQGEEKHLFAGSYEVLEDISFYPVSDEELDIFWEFYGQNDEELSRMETEVIVAWFIDCWKQAGGQNAKVHSYFSFHDVDKCYDLHDDKWITDGDKWE